MTYRLTPRQDRIARLDTEIARLTAVRDALIRAEEAVPEPEPEPPGVHRARHDAARRRLLAWSWTPEFAHRVATYGGDPGAKPTAQQEAS